MRHHTHLPPHRRLFPLPGLVALFAAFLAFGCSGRHYKQPKIHQYLLHYDGVFDAAPEPLPMVLRFERFQTAPAFDTKRMVYRKQGRAVQEYAYHRWRAHPGEMVGDQLRRDFQASRRFRAVLTPDSVLPYTHVLEGTVDAFFEDDREQRWSAAVEITLTLLAEARGDGVPEVLFQQGYADREITDRNHPAAVAEAMSRALERISRRALADVVRALSPEVSH
jgi:ABC-type uncharacterized transport system auxiliary subunit